MRESLRSDAFTLKELEPLMREILDSGGEFELAPRGTSMLPFIKEGRDTVILAKPDGRLKPDDIALYKRPNGRFVLHRVTEVLPDSYTMLGDNQTEAEKGIKDSLIIARVKALRRNGRLYPIDCKKFKKYVNRRRDPMIRRILIALNKLKK